MSWTDIHSLIHTIPFSHTHDDCVACAHEQNNLFAGIIRRANTQTSVAAWLVCF